MTNLYFQNRLLVVADESMQKTLNLALKAAQSALPVLISGESGTGKELIARFIHEKGARSGGPFVSVNCAALPETLIESELFGYERGAFTGAIGQRIGKFERANGGTLLMDEVSEMPYGLQAKLLRVLQEGEIDRLGSRDTIGIDCRIIATTNRDPIQMIVEERFREDLYYRLNVIRIECVPLRKRPIAIIKLAHEFIKQACLRDRKDEVYLSEQSIKKLVEYDWPGNIRELQNVMERAILLTDGNLIEQDNLQFMDQLRRRPEAVESSLLSDLEQTHILKVLEMSQGNRSNAAKTLGISVRTLRNKLKEYSAAG